MHLMMSDDTIITCGSKISASHALLLVVFIYKEDGKEVL